MDIQARTQEACLQEGILERKQGPFTDKAKEASKGTPEEGTMEQDSQQGRQEPKDKLGKNKAAEESFLGKVAASGKLAWPLVDKQLKEQGNPLEEPRRV